MNLTEEEKALDDAAQQLKDDAKKPPEDNPEMELDTLDDQSKAADDENFLAELNEQYTKNVMDGIEAARKLPIYAGGLQQEMVSAKDPTSLLLESQGYYYLHLVFFCMIQFGMILKTTDTMQCVMMNKNFDYSDMGKKENWNFHPTKKEFGDDWKGLRDAKIKEGTTTIPSNINDVLDQIKWMHLACVLLLFFANVSFVNRAGTAINFSSVMKIITVPYYFYMIFRVEATIRSLRTAYWIDPKGNGSKPREFHFARWTDYRE